MKKWPRERITIDGEQVQAAAPYIISASRATDVPAFYSKNFSRWLERGYCFSINPFNGIWTPVVFTRCRLFVFWSKNPAPFLPVLKDLVKQYEVIFQFTLNDYDDENYERKVPPLAQRIETFKNISNIIGKNNVVWRYDPVLVSDSIDAAEAARRTIDTGNRITGYTGKMVFSFIKIDQYKKVSVNIDRYNPGIRELTSEEKEEYLHIITGHNRKHWGLNIHSCGTPPIYSRFGIVAEGCISYKHVGSLGIADYDFNSFYEYTTPSLFGYSMEVPRSITAQGQQPYCRCIQSKDIGRYNSCLHGCVYCYANQSPEKARDLSDVI